MRLGPRTAEGARVDRLLVEIRGVTKVYRRGRERVEVLHGIDLDIPSGDFVALMGPSGPARPRCST